MSTNSKIPPPFGAYAKYKQTTINAYNTWYKKLQLLEFDEMDNEQIDEELRKLQDEYDSDPSVIAARAEFYRRS